MRLYVTLKSTPELLALYRGKDLDGLTRFTMTLLRAAQAHRLGVTRQQPSSRSGRTQPEAHRMFADIKAVRAPSLDWRASFVAEVDRDAAVGPQDVVPDELV